MPNILYFKKNGMPCIVEPQGDLFQVRPAEETPIDFQFVAEEKYLRDFFDISCFYSDVPVRA